MLERTCFLVVMVTWGQPGWNVEQSVGYEADRMVRVGIREEQLIFHISGLGNAALCSTSENDPRRTYIHF